MNSMNRPDRPFITLGSLATQFGWKYANLVQRLEAKRLAEAKEYYEEKKKKEASA